ncbi:hypothetical protein [Thioclava sp. F34-6]|uniref:hypothetical protein n=1 Tax=Thioclava sp. F34-6 TaxID=1973003 RepID=UPI0011BA5F7F|nr:hypothetical protein [Thioclava sp. F34-6]
MITERKLNDLLRKVQLAPEERLKSRSVCFENLFPGEDPDTKWVDLAESDASALRAAVRLGLLFETFHNWQPEWPDEFCPDGGDYIVTLSGLGTERLLRLNEAWCKRALSNVIANIPTIIVAVAIAVFSAWALKYLGPSSSSNSSPVSSSSKETRSE